MTLDEAIQELKSDIEWSKLNKYPYIGQRKVEALQMAIKALEQEPKTGRWILYRDYKNMVDYPQCDNCGVIIKLPLPMDNLNYCPNCGAKMEIDK